MLLLNILCAWLLFCAMLWVVLEWRSRVRPFLRGCRDWEKGTLVGLGTSLFLVLVLSWQGACRGGFTFWDGLFEALKVVFSVFEGDSKMFRDYAVHFPHIYGILACAVPALTVFAALRLLWSYLPHHVPCRAKQWLIFSELDGNSVRMAKSFGNGNHLCIFLRSRRDEQKKTEFLKELQNIRYFLYPRDEARFLFWPWRRKHILRFFFLSDNTDENFQRMQEFLAATETKKLFEPKDIPMPEGQFQQELYLLSETESAPTLIDHLRKGLKDCEVFQNTELHLLDRFRATSYDLLKEVPLHNYIHEDSRGKRVNVLILGFGKIGREFFRAACSLGVLHNCKTEFTLCDLAIDQKLNAFLCQCPELHRSVTFRHVELDAETDQLDHLICGRQFHYILVALGDDERNIRVTSRLKGHYRRLHWAYEAHKAKLPQIVRDVQPKICVNIEDSIKHAYSEGLWKKKFEGDHALYVFGGLDQVFSQKVLMPQNLWKAARWLHQELNRNKDGTMGNAGWGEYERRSSIACAAHAQYHVATVGQSYLELLHQWKQVLREDGRSEYDHLVDSEHRRWMAYVRSEGLRKANMKLVEVYYDEKHGRHVDTLGKLTPCLVDTEDKLQVIWEQLAQDHGSYLGKCSFRERDELLILNSQIIADGIRTGEFPKRATSEL